MNNDNVKFDAGQWPRTSRAAIILAISPSLASRTLLSPDNKGSAEATLYRADDETQTGRAVSAIELDR